MWKQIKAVGLGAALRPPMGQGRSSSGSPGGAKPQEAGEFTAFQTLNFEYPEQRVSDHQNNPSF